MLQYELFCDKNSEILLQTKANDWLQIWIELPIGYNYPETRVIGLTAAIMLTHTYPTVI